ncbi:MAG: hypothetical protein JO372_04020 [Solirubrobacterales bacterium]|nr:hypothetical protein [Solirubrobacterales bacterium]
MIVNVSLLPWASSIAVTANATPLDPPGDPEVDVTRRTPSCARAVRDDAAIRGKQRWPSRVTHSEAAATQHDASLLPPRELGPAEADGAARRRLPIAPLEPARKRPRRCPSHDGAVTSSSLAGLLLQA